MPIRVAINGYGRIGRNILRALYESGRTNEIQIVAINDLGNAETNAHLTRYDTAHGKFSGKVEVEGEHMIVNGDKIKVCAVRNPADLPWGELKWTSCWNARDCSPPKKKLQATSKPALKKSSSPRPVAKM